MQVIQLAQKNPPRTVPEKVKEMILATRLELSHTKDEILKLYAAHAPFGGNVVGLERLHHGGILAETQITLLG